MNVISSVVSQHIELYSQDVLHVGNLASFAQRTNRKAMSVFAVRVSTELVRSTAERTNQKERNTDVQCMFLAPLPTVKQSSPFTT